MNKKLLILSIILVLMWMGIIYYFSNMQKGESSGKSMHIISEIIKKIDKITNASQKTRAYHQSYAFLQKANFYFRRGAHIFVYLILSVLVVNVLLWFHKYKLYQCCLFSLFFCFIYACSDELHQSFVLGRTGRFLDTFVDIFGSIMGCLMLLLIKKCIKKGKAN